MKNELDLSGLKLVYGGLILQLVSFILTGRLASGMMNGMAGPGVLSFVIRAVSICIILAGVSRLGAASPFFTKAKKPYIVQLAVQILLAVVLAVLGRKGWSINSISETPRNTLIEMLLLILVILVVSIIAALFSVRAMLRGCGHVAEQVNDPLFSIKCLKNWRLWYMAYLLTILMSLAGIAMIVTVLRKTVESGSAGEDMTQAIFTNVTSSVLLVSIIVMVVLVFLLIVHIMYIGKIRTTYREYHLEEVKEPAAAEQRPVFADYVQNELNGVPEEENDQESEIDQEEESDQEEEQERRISGRKYRRLENDADENEETDTEDIMEIAKLFKKNRN